MEDAHKAVQDRFTFYFKFREDRALFLLSLTHRWYGESIIFESNFRSGDFDGFTRFEVP